jgi:beta-lactamase class A
MAGSAATMVRADEGANLDQASLQQRILDTFAGLPGTIAIKLWAPATAGQPEFLLQQNEAQQLLIGSSIKAFVLCERMRQLDSPNILTALTSQ